MHTTTTISTATITFTRSARQTAWAPSAIIAISGSPRYSPASMIPARPELAAGGEKLPAAERSDLARHEEPQQVLGYHENGCCVAQCDGSEELAGSRM